MEAQRPTCPAVSLSDQSTQLASCLKAIPAASSLSASPVILQPDQVLAQTVYRKAVTIPHYPPIQSDHLQPNYRLLPGQTSITLESAHLPLTLNPLLQSDVMDHLQTVIQKHPGPISIVSGLPDFSPCPPLGSPSKCKNVRKYICKQCGRDCLKPSVLEKHMRSHTGERPFPCTTCGIAFKTQSNLYKHKRTQTHVNNARLLSESDSNNLVEESEKLTNSIASPQKTEAIDKNCDHQRATVKHTSLVTNEKHSLDTSSLVGNTVFLVSESHWMTIDRSCHGGADQSVVEKETLNDSANPLPRRKNQEQRSLTISKPSQLQRQQATCSEKLWDNRSPDYKLKKCESTDSGYFSRSDSVEQQMLSPSPLHSLCEHVTETGDITFNNLKCAAENVSKTDAAEKARENLTLEKKKLEEHISKLISHNQAVVDDTQLENVRPRKTVLSKQGSIDLPMPYTYKDSFHFDIRSLDINRRKLSLCSTKSTFTPVERSKPLIFHSVPTQFSTTIDGVPVTRSNSMPFIECTRRVQDHVDILKVSATTSPDTGLSGLLDGKNLSSVIDFPASHHRALVRQAAVDDLPLSNVNESSPLEEIQNAKKLASGGERTSTKYKKPSQRKSKMFSQEKWQVYGDETFKKIYQKMKSSHTPKKLKGNRETDTSTLLSVGKEMLSCDGVLLPNDGRSSTGGNLLSSTIDVTAKLNTEESGGYSASSPVSQDVCSHESSGNLAEFMETSYAVSDTQHGEISKTFVGHRCTELLVSKQDLSSNSQVVPISTSCESSSQIQQPTGQKTNTHSNIASLHNSILEEHTQEEFIKCVPLHEAISRNEGDVSVGKEVFQLSQEVSLSNQCNVEPGQEPQNVPSERKKLKVEKLKSNKNIALKSNLNISTSTERIVKLLDHHKLDMVPAESVNNSVIGEKQKVVVGRNKSWSSRDCEETFPNSIMTSSNSSNKDYLADITETTTMSALEQHKSEVANNYGCNLCVLQSLTKQPCPMITGTVVSSKTRDRAQTPTSTQHLIFDEVTPCLKKNSFLPKYILKCSQEIVSPGMPLILAESEKMSCISLSSTSHSISVPASSNRLVSTNATDVLLCPLQLEMSHPVKTKESKWDMQRVWKPLVVCPTTVLETTRIDRRYHLQNITQKETMKDVRSAHNRDSSGDGKLTEEVDGHAIVCTSLTLGKKICFTTVYAGGIFISSDKTGQSSALELIHSKNSSVISLSSLVERTVLCEDTEKIKEWQSDSHSFSRPQELPTSSVSKPECLCHSSSMLYCHVLCPQEKEVNTPSQFSADSQAGTSKVPDMNVSFPTLNAEPQLTWCLSRNLPLPIEQKEKKDSAYSSLYMCKNEDKISKYGHSFCKMENTGKVASGEKKTGALKMSVPLFLEELQKEELNPSAAGVDGLFKNVTEPAEAKVQLHKMRESSRNKSKRGRKRKKMKINQKRYKKKYGHRCRATSNKQRNKQQWPTTRVLETPSSHSPNSHEQHCTKCLCFPTASQVPSKYDIPAREDIRQNCFGGSLDSSKLLIYHLHGNDENLQKTSYVINEKAAFPAKDKMKDFPSSTSEHGSSGLFLHEISTVLNVPVLKHSCPLASNAPAQRASYVDICSLGTLEKEEQSNVNSEHHWPSVGTCNFELIDTNKSCSCNITNLQVTVNSKANFKRVESKHQHFTVLQPSAAIMGRTEPSTERDLKNQHTSSIQTPCPDLLKSRMLTKTSVSNKTLPRPRYVQETKSAPLSCTDRDTKSAKLDSSHGEFSKPGFSVFKTPSAHVASSEALCKSSQHMEMTDKQTHVEYDNISSSDDEDRLVIEI